MLGRLIFRSRPTNQYCAILWRGSDGAASEHDAQNFSTTESAAQRRQFAARGQTQNAAAPNPHDHLLNRFRDLCRALPLKGKQGKVRKEIQLKWEDATQALLRQGLDSVNPSAPQVAKLLNYCREAHFVSKPLTDGVVGYALAKPDFASGLTGRLFGASIKCVAQLAGVYEEDAEGGAALMEFLSNLMDSGAQRGVFGSNSMGTRDLANCIHSLGLVVSKRKRMAAKAARHSGGDGEAQVGASPGQIDDNMQGAVQEMAAKFCDKATMNCEPLALSKALVGCSQIGLTDPPTIQRLQRVLQLNLANYGIYGGNTIAHILHALHTLGAASDPLVKLLGEHAKFAAPDLTSTQLFENIRAFARVGYGRSDVVGTLAKTLSKKHKIMELTEGQLADAVKALGSVGYSSKDVLLAFGDEILKDYRMVKTTPYQLGNTMLGYGGAGIYNSTIMAGLMGDVVAKFNAFSMADCVNVAYGLGLLRLKILYDRMTASATKFLTLLAAKAKSEGVGGMPVRDACKLAWGYGEMGYINAELMNALTGRVAEAIASGAEISDADLALVLEGCANTHHPCSEAFLSVVQQWVRKWLQHADNPHRMASILKSKAWLDDLLPWDYDQFCLQLLELQSRGSLLDRQIMDALEAATMHAIIRHEHTPNRKILDQLKDVRKKDPEEEVRRTRLLKNIVSAMKEIGIEYKVGEQIEVYPGGTLLVDVLVAGKDGTKIAVLCEPQQQYSMNDPDGEFQLMGGAIFKKRLLEKLGYQVVNVSCYLTKVGRKNFIVESLSSINCITMNET